MSVPYIVSARTEPGVKGGGIKKYYARVRMRGTVSLDALSERISTMSSLSRADITGVLTALTDVLPDLFEEGYAVDMGRLGRMRISVGSVGHLQPGEVSARSIRRPRMVFTPGKAMRQRLKLLKFSRKV